MWAGADWRAACGAAALLALAAAVPAQEASTAEDTGNGLSLVNLSLLDSRDGYAIPADSRFLPGETVHVYFQVRGYGIGESERVSLEYEVRARDPDGRRFFMAEAGKVDVTLAPQDKDWMPVMRYSPRIPKHAGGGTYIIDIEVRDEIGKTSVAARLPVRVDGDRVQSAGELQVRNFRFVRSEGGDPMPDAAFAAGDCVRAEFFITGYETRADNTFQVESDAWVADPQERRMFEFETGAEHGSPYYPRLWLPGRLEFDLGPGMSPGQYTVMLRVRDLVGGEEALHRYRFRVR